MSKKVKPITRTLTVSSISWLTNELTINTSAAHGLISGDTISFQDQNGTATYRDLVVTLVDTDTFKVPMTDKYCKPPTTLLVDVWNTGATGAQEVFTFGFSGHGIGLVQITSTASAATTGVKVEGSLDGSHWVDVATAAALAANGSNMITIDKPYAYGRINFTGATTGAGGKVKAFLSI